jgi:AcrR family transcriptional regulator
MPRPDVSEERKDQILEAATKVFARQGIQEARMDDIVKESGLSKGALYWYFKSKEDIIFAILSNLFERELADLQKLIEAEGSAGDRLIEFTRHTVADLKRMPLFMPLAYEFYTLSFRNKTVRRALKRYLHGYFDILMPIIQQGIDRGEFRPVDVQEAAIAAGAMFEGTLLLWVYDPDTVKFEKHIETGARLLLQGLRAPNASTAATS